MHRKVERIPWLISGVDTHDSYFSFGDVSDGAIWDDVIFLTCGYFMIYAYVQIMLGKFNRVEQRVGFSFAARTFKLHEMYCRIGARFVS